MAAGQVGQEAAGLSEPDVDPAADRVVSQRLCEVCLLDADGNKSSNIDAGNNRPRCSARNVNTLPAGNRCPASDSTSSSSRCGSLTPCTTSA